MIRTVLLGQPRRRRPRRATSVAAALVVVAATALGTPLLAPATAASATPTPTNLATNGGFNDGFGSWQVMPQTNWATYHSGVTGNDPYEGTQFVATNTTDGNGGIFLDIPVTIDPGDTFCGSAQVATEGSGSGAAGIFAVWLLGGASPENSSKPFANLPGGNGWTPVQTCVTATAAHSSIRVQFYDTPNTPTLIIDAVDLHASVAVNGGFNDGFGSWQVMPQTNWATYHSGVTGNDPYEGTQFVATNTTDGNGGIFQDVPVSIAAGDTFCGSAQVATQGSGGGAGGIFAVWLLGGASPENSSKPFAYLPGGNGWTPLQTCVTATAAHSSIRVQFYDTPNTPTLIIDAVDVHANLATNGGFNDGFGSWQVMPQTNVATYHSGVTGNDPYEGTQFVATNTTDGNGGIFQDVPATIDPGDTFCATAQVATQGSGSGAGGIFAVWLLGGASPENSSKPFANLPGGNGWTPVQACVTATAAHSSIRVQFYDTPNTPTLIIDAVSLALPAAPPTGGDPAPRCTGRDIGFDFGQDENPVYPRTLLNNILAEVVPHIEWCGKNRLRIQQFADLDVIPQTSSFISYELVGGKKEPKIGGDGNGHYIQSVKITYGYGLSAGGKTFGAVKDCTMTINRVYKYNRAGFYFMDGDDDLGSCTPLIVMDMSAVGAIAEIPPEGAQSYPPVFPFEMQLVDLNNDGEPDRDGAGELVIATFSGVFDNGNTQTFFSDDFVDPPLGGGGGGGWGDPDWTDYMVDAEEEYAA